MSEEFAHEAVASSLMDLQARLRGDGHEEAATQTAIDADETQELVRVPEAMPIFVNRSLSASPVWKPSWTA